MAGNLEKVFERIDRVINRLVAKSERQIAQRYAQTLLEIRTLLAKYYERYEQGGTLTYAEMAKYDRLYKLLKEIDRMLGQNYKDLAKIYQDVLGEAYQEGYYLTAWAIETDVQAKLAYSTVVGDTILAMINNPISGLSLNMRLKKNRADIVHKIQQELTQGLVKGETYSSMAKRLKGALEGDAVKATRIVRTEGHRVQESSKHDAVEHAHKQGVVMAKEWNSLGDEVVRAGVLANHRKLNGVKIPVHENFKQGGASGPAPGQMGTAAHDINCRCFLTYTVVRVERKTHTEMESVTYDKWLKERRF
ncbi:phage Mu protein F like protein [Brevibacillus sp. AG162]|uniref:phage minor head protein n=1 Tax=Brevibacillus sp. AG162 TaxID=2572910 RepID=UPI00114D6078|nr:phage minor head protein [Brevibacillus sp. AG162]TQK41959.1 phage Mu protein F like protein [Brevibacillus sp. AG162]